MDRSQYPGYTRAGAGTRRFRKIPYPVRCGGTAQCRACSLPECSVPLRTGVAVALSPRVAPRSACRRPVPRSAPPASQASAEVVRRWQSGRVCGAGSRIGRRASYSRWRDFSYLSATPRTNTRVGEQQNPQLLCAARSVTIARIGGDDAADHHDLPLPREPFRVGQTSLFSQFPDEIANRSDVAFRRSTNRMCRVIVLKQHLYKCATFEVGPAKPTVEDIEDGKQPISGPSRTALHTFLQPCSRP